MFGWVLGVAGLGPTEDGDYCAVKNWSEEPLDAHHAWKRRQKNPITQCN